MNASQHKGPVRLFPEIYDLSDFVSTQHPVNLHPKDPAYRQYWEKIERYCVEGKWGKDMCKRDGKTLGGYRYMPRNLFFYGNCCNIRLQTKKGADTTFPDITDVEWIFGTDWEVCLGFSGFEYDPVYTCFKPIRSIELGLELTEAEKYFLEEVVDPKTIFKKNGKYKKYIDPVKYLQSTFVDEFGLPVYYNEALDSCSMGSRGLGKTYWLANGVSLHEYKFFGATRYDSTYFNAVKNQTGKKVFIRSAVEKNINDIISATRITLNFQETTLGAYKSGRTFTPGFFHRAAVGVLQGNNVKNPYSQSIQLRVKSDENDEDGIETFSWISLESGASLNYAIATANNPAPGTGGRYSAMGNDEIGRNAKLKKGRQQERDCMIMNYKFGRDALFGTSGELENVADALEIMNNPEQNDILAFEDNFEFTGHKIGRFFPAYYADRKFKDALGNTDLVRAWKNEIEVRKRFEDNNDTDGLAGRKLNRPIFPSEMAGTGLDFYLPREMAAKRKVYLQRTGLYKKKKLGKFIHPNNNPHEVEFVEVPGAIDIDVHAPEKNNIPLYGCVAIYEFPPPNLPPRKYYNNLYKVFGDPVKDDKSGLSLFVGGVYKGYPADTLDPNSEIDNIVATIVCRRDEVEAGLIICFQLAIFYQAYFLFEGNVGPTMTLARLKGWEYLLQPTPYAALKTMHKSMSTKWTYGVNVNTTEKLWGERKLNEWLKRPWKKDKEGNQLYNIDKLLWLYCLEQISIYNREGNFDSISALIVLMIWLHQEEIVYVEPEEPNVNKTADLYKELRYEESISDIDWDYF